MTVRRREDGVIVLDGVCAVEDAEPLLQLLLGAEDAACDWTRCGQIHTAVAQVLLVAGPAMIGPCGDAWVEQWIGPELTRRRLAVSAGQP